MGELCSTCPPISFLYFGSWMIKRYHWKVSCCWKTKRKCDISLLSFNTTPSHVSFEKTRIMFLPGSFFWFLLIPSAAVKLYSYNTNTAYSWWVFVWVLLFVGFLLLLLFFLVSYLLVFNTEDLLRSTKFETVTPSELPGLVQILRQHKDCNGVRIQRSRELMNVSSFHGNSSSKLYAGMGIAAW